MAKRNKKSSFGPGFLVAAAFIGPGTVTACSLAGARFGYALIFALIFAVVTTLILQGMTGRLSLGSGYDLGQSLRKFPKNEATKILFVILTLSSITFGCAAYEAGNLVGGALGLEMVSSVSKKIWVLSISLVAAFVLSRKKYRIVEKFLIFLVFFMSLSFLITAILVKPDLLSILKGSIPTFPDKSLYLVLALVGTTVVPYNLFLHSSAVKQKWQNKKDLRDVRKDLLTSISLGGLISVSVVVTSAVAFYEKGITLESGAQMAQQLKPLFGSFTNLLFGMGLFAAGLSSAITAPYAAAFASSGILGWEEGHNSGKFRATWIGVIGTGLVVSLFDFNPLAIIVFAQVANGLVLPVASLFLLIVLNNRQRMRDLANTPVQNIIGGLVILLVSFLGIWNILKLIL
ncbi:MAG: Nramp family divalent metal transporter [Candidatus Aminicenantes bacterium]|nr:MAG: Nramp family divalent metal transporter [Candidatus Aminicenantes bacterium]